MAPTQSVGAGRLYRHVDGALSALVYRSGFCLRRLWSVCALNLQLAFAWLLLLLFGEPWVVL